MVHTVTSSYPNPPMLEAAVPSPNTFPVEEPIGLLKAGVWPNDAVEPNAWGLPKAGGLPNTGALPKPPVEQKQLPVFPSSELFWSAPGLNEGPTWGLMLGSYCPDKTSFQVKMTWITSARLPGGKQQKHADIWAPVSGGKEAEEEETHWNYSQTSIVPQ